MLPRRNASARPTAYWNIWLPRPPDKLEMISRLSLRPIVALLGKLRIEPRRSQRDPCVLADDLLEDLGERLLCKGAELVRAEVLTTSLSVRLYLRG